jgi:radical SAM superfamily enzyme YgiQ (UPF0313 family)
MRVILVDLNGTGGHVNKDTVSGGYGSRFRGTSKTTKVIEIFRKIYQNFPSIHTAYLAAIFSEAGHKVFITRDRLLPGDLALVLTSIVDFRREREWALRFKNKYGSPVGFFGAVSTHVPEVLSDYGDFLIQGEPEQAVIRLAAGAQLKGPVISPAISNLDSLPFPKWEAAARSGFSYAPGRSLRPIGGIFPILSSRSCPEFCTYCPHRITATYRARNPMNVISEIEYLAATYGNVDLIFRDPLFTEERERSGVIAEEIISRKLPVRFECETRLDDWMKI